MCKGCHNLITKIFCKYTICSYYDALLHERSYPLVGFPPFVLQREEAPNIVPRCFCTRYWQGERIALSREMGTISREATVFGGTGGLHGW